MEIKKIFRSGNSLVVSLGSDSKFWLKVVEGDRVLLQNVPGGIVQLKKISGRIREIEEQSEGDNG